MVVSMSVIRLCGVAQALQGIAVKILLKFARPCAITDRRTSV